MRPCNQKQCIFLMMKNGCKKCEDCGATEFLIADDCPRCYECENLPDACRWTDDNSKIEDANKETKNKNEEKPIEIKVKSK